MKYQLCSDFNASSNSSADRKGPPLGHVADHTFSVISLLLITKDLISSETSRAVDTYLQLTLLVGVRKHLHSSLSNPPRQSTGD